MKRIQGALAGALALVIGSGVVFVPQQAQASEEGRRNTMLGLGAAAAALLLTQKNKLPGIVAAAGAAYAYKRYNDDVVARHRREREYGYYNDQYNNGGYNNGGYQYRQNDDQNWRSSRYYYQHRHR